MLERDGELELERVAVGDHILLGGDNMDLALAHVVARKLATERHAARRLADARADLRAAARAKEKLLARSVAGRGADRHAGPRLAS